MQLKTSFKELLNYGFLFQYKVFRAIPKLHSQKYQAINRTTDACTEHCAPLEIKIKNY